MSGRFAKVLGLAGMTAVLFAGWSYAQRDADAVSPEKLLPEQSIMYLRTDGSLLHADAFKNTAAYEALYESGLMETVEKVFEAIPSQPQFEEIATAMKHVEENGLSVGITIDPPVAGPPQPWGVIVVHNAASGLELVDSLVEQIPGNKLDIQNVTIRGREVRMTMIPDSPVEVGYWAEQGHLMVAVGLGAVEAAVAVADGERGNLSTNPLFERYSSASEGVAFHTTSWFELETLKKMFGGMPVPAPGADPDHPVTVTDVVVALGLENLNHVAARSGYKGPAMWNEVVIDAPGEKKGLLRLIDQKSMTLDDLPPIPTGHAGFMASSFDYADAYDALLEVCYNVAKFGPPAAKEQIEKGIKRAEAEIGLNVRDDILAHIGNVNCVYTDSKQGIFGLGSSVLMSVKNDAALKVSLRKLFDRIEEETRGDVEFVDMEKNGHVVTLMKFPEFPIVTPTLHIGDDWIIVGIVPQAVEATLMRLEGDLPSWKADDEYKAAFAALPDRFTSLTALETRPTYEFLMSLAPFAAGGVEMAMRESGQFPDDFELPISALDVPPSELVTAPLFPNMAVTTVSEDGIVIHARQSLPSMPTLGGGTDGGTAIATSGILVALLLPAVQQAREAARRTQSKNNMKQILLAMHNYHDVNNGLPTGTIENENLKPDDRLSWLVSILPYIEQQPLWQEINMKEGWNSEANQFATETVVPVFNHPSAPEPWAEDFFGATNYVGMAGVGADAPTLPIGHKRAGLFGYDRQTKFRDILDGLSNTIAIMEVNDAGAWASGGKSTIRGLANKPYINGPDGFGSPNFGPTTNIGMGDGSVRTISENIDPSVLEALSTMAGNEVINDFDF